MKTIKKGECPYSVSNAIRTLVMVPVAGLEPARVAPLDFESSTSANSITPANTNGKNYYSKKLPF